MWTKIFGICVDMLTHLTDNGPILAIAMHMQSNLFDLSNACIDGALGNAERIETADDEEAIGGRIE